MCGEKKRLAACAQTAEGSPPRMRGKAFRPAVIARWHRITPACAGKSCPLPRRTVSVRDHPRVCGEKRPDWKNEVELVGSPPRVRGKDYSLAVFGACIGITPACAGKSRDAHSQKNCGRDHPRVCGEKQSRLRGSFFLRGSPPRVRGKAKKVDAQNLHQGITPACAGKRLKRSHSIGHFSCILCLFHSVLHRASASGGSRAGPCAPPCLPAQNAVPV